jgi:hypothetical protein
MSAENIDFTAILANMEAKRGALDAAIASLRAAIASGALGAVSAGDLVGIPGAAVGITQGGEIPNGAFLGKSVSEAIKLYLSIVKKKQKTRQIVEALKRGGIESKSDKFNNIVYNSLDRMRSVTGEIAKIGKEWGLKEWYHPGIAAPVQARRNQKKSTRRGTPQHASTLPSKIEALVGAAPEKTYTPSQIASALGVSAPSINVRLKRMLDRGRIVKVGPGQYRAGKTGVVKMQATG